MIREMIYNFSKMMIKQIPGKNKINSCDINDINETFDNETKMYSN